MLVDRITLFSICPPELMKIIDKVHDYYRWFSISKIMLKNANLHKQMNVDMNKCSWIDGRKQVIKLRRKVFPAIELHLELLQMK